MTRTFALPPAHYSYPRLLLLCITILMVGTGSSSFLYDNGPVLENSSSSSRRSTGAIKTVVTSCASQHHQQDNYDDENLSSSSTATTTTTTRDLLTGPFHHERSKNHTNNVDPQKEGKEEEERPCVDQSKDCEAIVASNHNGARDQACILNFTWMQTNCRKTCLLCENTKNNVVIDEDDDENHHQVVSNIYSDYPQRLFFDSPTQMSYLSKVNEYMYNQVFAVNNNTNDDDKQYENIKMDCKNRHADCTAWAERGECNQNPNYMTLQCAPACFTCDQLSFDVRCPYNKAAPQTWSSHGDLNAMFTRMTSSSNTTRSKYNLTILSQPNVNVNNNNNKNNKNHNKNNNIHDITAHTLPPAPWVVMINDFLTIEECEFLQDQGEEKGFERSQNVGGVKADGSIQSYVSSGRTSSNTCTCV